MTTHSLISAVTQKKFQIQSKTCQNRSDFMTPTTIKIFSNYKVDKHHPNMRVMVWKIMIFVLLLIFHVTTKTNIKRVKSFDSFSKVTQKKRTEILRRWNQLTRQRMVKYMRNEGALNFMRWYRVFVDT